MFSAEGKYDELGTHYYKNSLFGTPFESGKQISIINYDPYMNGRWKETRQTIKGPGVNYDKMAAACNLINFPIFPFNFRQIQFCLFLKIKSKRNTNGSTK
jgi:hypothetical protein